VLRKDIIEVVAGDTVASTWRGIERRGREVVRLRRARYSLFSALPNRTLTLR